MYLKILCSTKWNICDILLCISQTFIIKKKFVQRYTYLKHKNTYFYADLEIYIFGIFLSFMWQILIEYQIHFPTVGILCNKIKVLYLIGNNIYITVGFPHSHPGNIILYHK